jgi:hypothetical protein
MATAGSAISIGIGALASRRRCARPTSPASGRGAESRSRSTGLQHARVRHEDQHETPPKPNLQVWTELLTLAAYSDDLADQVAD